MNFGDSIRSLLANSPSKNYHELDSPICLDDFFPINTPDELFAGERYEQKYSLDQWHNIVLDLSAEDQQLVLEFICAAREYCLIQKEMISVDIYERRTTVVWDIGPRKQARRKELKARLADTVKVICSRYVSFVEKNIDLSSVLLDVFKFYVHHRAHPFARIKSYYHKALYFFKHDEEELPIFDDEGKSVGYVYDEDKRVAYKAGFYLTPPDTLNDSIPSKRIIPVFVSTAEILNAMDFRLNRLYGYERLLA